MDVHRKSKPAARSDHFWLDQLAATGPPIPDHVLLCCFGPELTGTRHHRQLSGALQRVGYGGPLVQHLIRVSPLLVRGAGRCYRLKRCDESRFRLG
jgi:hypothetical protein